jgi:hypothetical protein
MGGKCDEGGEMRGLMKVMNGALMEVGGWLVDERK